MDLVAKNKKHYDKLYSEVNIDRMVERVRNLDGFLKDALATDTSWRGLYLGGLEKRLAGCKVLELGAGDGLNALVMAALGADVVAVDISERTPVIVEEAGRRLGLSERVAGYAADFLTMEDFAAESFDLVVGKAFLHHLDHEIEGRFLDKTAKLLKPGGEARFLEPATNSPALDRLRFMVPVPGRPSSLNKAAFTAWEEADPHPKRDNSSEHYRQVVARNFRKVDIFCIGSIERLHRLLPKGDANRSFRRLAFRAEKMLPARSNEFLARSQLIVCREPVKGQ